MKMIDGAAIGESKARHALAGRNATVTERRGVLARDVCRRSIALQLVVQIDHASIEGNDVAHLVDHDRERVFEIERRAEGARNLVERIDLPMRVLDLVMGGRK